MDLSNHSRALFDMFARVMINLIFKQIQGDHTLFIKHSEMRGVTVLLIYINDIILIKNNENEQRTPK